MHNCHICVLKFIIHTALVTRTIGFGCESQGFLQVTHHQPVNGCYDLIKLGVWPSNL